MVEQIDALPHLEGLYTVTSTQYSAYALCPRRWWMRYVCKIRPEERQTYFTFGSVLHQVTDRYRLGGQRQIVPDGPPELFEPGNAFFGQKPGDPVNLFPPTFHKVKERDGTWESLDDPTDRHKIVQLIHHAIENGVLTHMSDQVVEDMILRPLSKGMAYRSFIDAGSYTEGEVRDSKTVGSAKRLKSPRALAKDTQQLPYGWHVVLKRREMGLPDLERIQIRHDQYQKWNCKTKFTYAKEGSTQGVSIPTLEANWNRLIEASKGMKRLLDEGPHRDWPSVEGPKPNSGACEAGGREGCPYRNICTGCQPMPDSLPKPKFTDMSAPTPLPRKDQLPWVPWAQHDCPACGGTGINAELSHCLECHGYADQKYKPYWSSVTFDDNSGLWTLRFMSDMDPILHAAIRGQVPEDQQCAAILGHRIRGQEHVHIYTPTGEFPPVETEDAMLLDTSQMGDEFAPETPPVITLTPEPAVNVPPLPTPVSAPVSAPAPVAKVPAPAKVEPSPEPEYVDADTDVEETEAEAELDTAVASGDWAAALPAALAVQSGKSKVKGRGAPKKTFTLCMGHVALDGFTVVEAEPIVAACMTLVAKANGKDSYWGHDSFKRRDALVQFAPTIAEMVKGNVLRFSGITTETRDLVYALAALATTRIEAI
jgi:hypothetical protein